MPRTHTAPSSVQARGGSSFQPGDEHFLWGLVLVELAVLAVLRHQFRHAHGG
jgi:hypothetical protein